MVQFLLEEGDDEPPPPEGEGEKIESDSKCYSGVAGWHETLEEKLYANKTASPPEEELDLSNLSYLVLPPELSEILEPEQLGETAFEDEELALDYAAFLIDYQLGKIEKDPLVFIDEDNDAPYPLYLELLWKRGSKSTRKYDN